MLIVRLPRKGRLPIAGMNPMKPEISSIAAGRVRSLGSLLAALLVVPGCAVPVHQQRFVSKPSMQFSDSPVFLYQSRLLAQVEPGAAASGGAQAAGCTSCR